MSDDIEAMLLLAIIGPPKRHRRTMARAFAGPGRRFAVPSTPTGETRESRLATERRRLYQDVVDEQRSTLARALRARIAAEGGTKE
jgi:hypothetical protein